MVEVRSVPEHMKVVVTDYTFPSLEIEEAILGGGGV